MGGIHPVRVQSMTTTNTMNTPETVQQAIRIIKAGGELVRITTQGRSEAKNLENIKSELRKSGYETPLVADIHFNPIAANIAAKLVEKVRVNPGNFTGGAKKFDFSSHSDETYRHGLEQMREKLIPFLKVCTENQTAIRIGTNHGSLSDRIMSRFGDTSEGMVESCMEYLRICESVNFHNIVLSIKASNTRIMVHTVRLLVACMKKENMNYPIHLGVTEAGNDDEGRIKSAVGIGALLADGIGDTVRVSLTEAPENEIPVATKLVRHIGKRVNHDPISTVPSSHYSPYSYVRRRTHVVLNAGGDHPAIVVCKTETDEKLPLGQIPDYYWGTSLPSEATQVPWILPAEVWEQNKLSNTYPCYEWSLITKSFDKNQVAFLTVSHHDLSSGLFQFLHAHPQVILLLESQHINRPSEQRAFFFSLMNQGITHPVILLNSYDTEESEDFQIQSAADAGLLFIDGLADGLCLTNKYFPHQEVTKVAFGILQAARVRITQTEFISCPGCGRTLFDLQTTTNEVKKRTSHLKGLKIGIMGCIINGIGEMADADYGYIGSGPNTVSLFKNKTLIKRDLPNNEAVEALIELIKEHDDWVDP
jgi:(E)-4-hydroxy-3-methylbut-2-enyl-diphosphate synthase